MKYLFTLAIASLLVFFAFSNKTYPPLVVSSSAFADSCFIPERYTCDGLGVNPPIQIDSIPEGTQSLVVIIEDPDVIVTYDHWVIFNIRPTNMDEYKTIIEENSRPGIEGQNGSGDIGYKGSCPPKGIHHYHFKVYAINTMIHLQPGTTKRLVEAAMRGHILAYGELMGLYKKKGGK